METQIQSIHFNADTSLREFIYDKVQSLDKVYSRIESSTVVLRLDKNDKKENKMVEIDLRIPGTRLFAKDQAETFEEATVLVVEELRRQLEKKKGRMEENVDGNLFESDVPSI